MKPSMGAAVRLHRNAVRDRPDLLSAFKWNACPSSPESALKLANNLFLGGLKILDRLRGFVWRICRNTWLWQTKWGRPVNFPERH